MFRHRYSERCDSRCKGEPNSKLKVRYRACQGLGAGPPRDDGYLAARAFVSVLSLQPGNLAQQQLAPRMQTSSARCVHCLQWSTASSPANSVEHGTGWHSHSHIVSMLPIVVRLCARAMLPRVQARACSCSTLQPASAARLRASMPSGAPDIQAVNRGMPDCPGRRSTKADSTAALASPASTRARKRPLPHEGAGAGSHTQVMAHTGN